MSQVTIFKTSDMSLLGSNYLLYSQLDFNQKFSLTSPNSQYLEISVKNALTMAVFHTLEHLLHALTASGRGRRRKEEEEGKDWGGREGEGGGGRRRKRERIGVGGRESEEEEEEGDRVRERRGGEKEEGERERRGGEKKGKVDGKKRVWVIG